MGCFLGLTKLVPTLYISLPPFPKLASFLHPCIPSRWSMQDTLASSLLECHTCIFKVTTGQQTAWMGTIQDEPSNSTCGGNRAVLQACVSRGGYRAMDRVELSRGRPQLPSGPKQPSCGCSILHLDNFPRRRAISFTSFGSRNGRSCGESLFRIRKAAQHRSSKPSRPLPSSSSNMASSRRRPRLRTPQVFASSESWTLPACLGRPRHPRRHRCPR